MSAAIFEAGVTTGNRRTRREHNTNPARRRGFSSELKMETGGLTHCRDVAPLGSRMGGRSVGGLARTQVRLCHILKSLRTSLVLWSHHRGIRIGLHELRNLAYRIRETRNQKWDTAGLWPQKVQKKCQQSLLSHTYTETPAYMAGIRALEAEGPCALTPYDAQLFLRGYFWAQAERDVLLDSTDSESHTTPVPVGLA
jgi:hypothetical protein